MTNRIADAVGWMGVVIVGCILLLALVVLSVPSASAAEETHKRDGDGVCRVDAGHPTGGQYADDIKCTSWEAVAISAGVLLVGYLLTQTLNEMSIDDVTEYAKDDTKRWHISATPSRTDVQFSIGFN